MRIQPLLIFCVATAGLMLGCKTVPVVPYPPGSSTDATPPLLKLGSAGLRKDLLLNQGSTAPEQRRARLADEVLFVATAGDAETGIKSVTLDLTLSVICGETGTNQNFAVTQTAPEGTGTLPTELVASYTFKPAQYRAGCRESPSSVSLSVAASTENGAGNSVQIQPARISSYGPDTPRVATFNLYAPKGHEDSTYQRWGKQLGAKADVLILTEVIDQRRAELVANAAGLAHMVKMKDGDVAIASRTPLYDVRPQVIDPPGDLTSNNSNTLSVKSDIRGAPHQFIGTHWGIRDAKDVLMPPHVSSPSRLEAAKAIVSLASSSPALVFVGGDMNAFSGFGPQDHDDNPTTPDFVGSTKEVDLLLTRFTDPFIAMKLANEVFCSNKRIDYVMVTGPYIPVTFEACFGEAGPSDHPFVMVTFEAGDL